MGKTGVDKASSLIKENLIKETVLPTESSKKTVEDFILSSDISLLLCNHGHQVTVTAKDGDVTLTINRKVLRLKRLEEELKSIIEPVQDVKSLKTEIGKKFHKSDIYRKLDFEKPSRVLLVDDEREFVQTLSERLELREMGSAVVHDGESALDIVEKDAPEVMIIDLKMSGVSGMDVLKKVKESHPDIEVIVLTGHGNEQDRQVCLDLGAFEYLQKPVDIEFLNDTLKRAQKKIRKKSGD